MPWATKKQELRCGLVSYLEGKHGDDFNCRERVFRISDDAVKNFYLYRALSRKMVARLESKGCHLVGYRQVTLMDNVMTPEEFNFHKDYQLYVCDHEIREDKNGRKQLVSFNPILLEHSGGHLNIADECWKFWPARSWQSTSETDVFYNAQHGKVGDDCLFITHRHNDIDSVIVDRCQESVVLTHHGKMTFGRLRRPDVFTAATYAGRPQPSKEPMSTKTFRLDRAGLAACYDTSAGVGVTGRGDADRGARKRGIPFWTIFPAGLVAICLVILVYKAGMGWIHQKLAFGKPVPSHSVIASNSARGKTSVGDAVSSSSSPERLTSPAASEKQIADVRPHNENQATNEVYCVGYVTLPRDLLVFMSDGETYSYADGEVQAVTKRLVRVMGRDYPVRRREPEYLESNSGVVRSISQPVGGMESYESRDSAGNVSVTYIGAPRARQPVRSSPFVSHTQGIQPPSD